MKLRSDSRSRRQSSRRGRSRRRRASRTYATAVPLTQRLGGLLAGQSLPRTASARLRPGLASIGSRLLALFLALGMSGVLIWFFVDYRFFVYTTAVFGADLTSAEDIYQASGLDEMSIFYVNRRKAADQICDSLIAVQSASISCALPARVQVGVRERPAAYRWHSGVHVYLVDEDGLVLRLDDGLHEDLVTIENRDGGPLAIGDRVEPGVLRTVRQLRALLPEATVFQYSEAKGVSLTAAQGTVINFGDGRDLQAKVACVKAIQGETANAGQSAQFIDVRFVASPYYR